MKRLVIVLFLMLPLSLYAQTKKQPGENSIIAWTNPASDDTKITGWRIYAAPASTGPYVFTGNNAPPVARNITIPTQFPPNSLKVFYQVKSFVTSNSVTTESPGIPAAGVEVVLSCKCQ